MKYTTNYNLKKPDQDDFYNIEDLNSNAEVIDTELKKIDEKANATEQRAKAYTDQEVETLTQETTQAIDTVNQRITSHKAENVTAHNVSRGTSTFAGSGNEVTIPHDLPTIPISAYAFPIINPEGYLGEVWIRMDETNLYVGNSGSFNGAMSWTAIG